MENPIHIIEVGPRDGLQNETVSLPISVKVQFIDMLACTGVSEIEAGAFVSPMQVPQLADTEDVLARIDRKPQVVYSALVPNRRGLERAIEAGIDKVSVFTSASETFNHKNINTSIEGSIRRFESVLAEAHAAGLPVRVIS